MTIDYPHCAVPPPAAAGMARRLVRRQRRGTWPAPGCPGAEAALPAARLASERAASDWVACRLPVPVRLPQARMATLRMASAMLTLLACGLLAGCSTPRLPATATIVLPRPQAEAAPPATLMLADETAPLLAYHQQVRRMTQGELLQELAALGMRQPSARVALQTGMALLWTRGAGDLLRAQAQFDSVASSTHPLSSLAALLSALCQEQRRLAEHGDKLAAQLKESQRKSEQLAETLESLKAIERNLPARGASNERQR